MFGDGVISAGGFTGSIVLNGRAISSNANPREAVIYKRPSSFANEDRIFFDLVSSAPGMGITTADVLAVIEAETVPDPAIAPGKIDPATRKLIKEARNVGRQSYEPPGGVVVSFDGAGRYRYERTLFAGLREQVICDGQTLWHLYPDLGIGAKRTVSRFHQAEFARLVPWVLPKPEDIARRGPCSRR